MTFENPGWKQKLHFARFTVWVIFWTLYWRPTFVYASDYLSCPASLIISFIPGVKLIYHEHDSPSSQSPSLFTRMCLAARKRLSGRTALCILPNQERAERFAQQTRSHQEVVCIWNCPAAEEVIGERAAFNSGDVWVLYHGSVVPSRLPIKVINALALLPASVKLRVIGYETVGHKGYLKELETRAQELNLSERVDIIGTVPSRNELLRRCGQCDIGLAFMPKNSADFNEQTMTGASNKPFDYLACGLVLLVADLPDWRSFYVEPGYGLACDPEDPESVAGALQWCLDHPAEVRKMGDRGRQRIAADWNYDAQFKPVLDLLESV